MPVPLAARRVSISARNSNPSSSTLDPSPPAWSLLGKGFGPSNLLGNGRAAVFVSLSSLKALSSLHSSSPRSSSLSLFKYSLPEGMMDLSPS